ncbi:hypothetical protein BJ741DRAFT_703147 [Chytriomyces cf. hyalinus JEL632]|nr:hypothetical protein BJ741DRAFT_703147 [Chytriomyces cf. hyalinus JEL632]
MDSQWPTDLATRLKVVPPSVVDPSAFEDADEDELEQETIQQNEHELEHQFEDRFEDDVNENEPVEQKGKYADSAHVYRPFDPVSAVEVAGTAPVDSNPWGYVPTASLNEPIAVSVSVKDIQKDIQHLDIREPMQQNVHQTSPQILHPVLVPAPHVFSRPVDHDHFSAGPTVASLTKQQQQKSWLSGLIDSVLDYVDPASAYTQIDQLDRSNYNSAQPSTPSEPLFSPSFNDSSIPDHHYRKAMDHLAENEHLLAISEFTLAATLGPSPHPEAMRCLMELHNDPESDVYDPSKAIEWTQARLMVLSTPEGMLAQARFLCSTSRESTSPVMKNGFGEIGRPRRWFMDRREDMEAALLIRQAAEAMYAPALHAYAVYLLENGHGGDALVWFNKAVEHGVWESGKWIVDMYERGVGVPINRDAANAWRKKVEEKETAMMLLAEVKRKEDEEAVKRYRAEADFLAFKKHRQEMQFKIQEEQAKNRREIDGSFNATLKYLKLGYYMLAIDELCTLARAGNIDAQEFIDPDTSLMPRDKLYSGPAMFCFAEYFAKRNDASRAANWYRNAAETNHPDAQVTYAAYLITGKGLPCQDPGQSVVWLMKAWSAAKHKEAAMALGDAFTKGIGVAPDPSKALMWYQRAWVEGQFVEAAFAVGLAFATGYTPGYVKPVAHWDFSSGQQNDRESGAGKAALGAPPVRRSYEKAVEWYELAGKFGHARSCNNLGEMYMMGRGVIRNDYIGVSYFRRAADQGLPEAKYNVGRCYRDGRGCHRDERAALEWFKQAEALGVKEASLAIQESELFEGNVVPK